MQIDELKRLIQNHLTDGLIVVVGSGLSAAAGLSGMPGLARHLTATVPKDLAPQLLPSWGKVADALSKGLNLEEVLLSIPVEPELETIIINVTANLIESEERAVVQRVLSGSQELPIGRLFNYLFKVTDTLNVITSNYDRLIEVAAEVAGYGIDTMFVGQLYGRFDARMSREALGIATQTKSRKEIKRVYRKHIRIFKPHGSLDWYTHDMMPVRCSVPLDLPRLMIAPGATKYLRGYSQPFDAHREEANRAIDNAARLLVVGYGFNDQQLETHLRDQLKRGIPCVVITRSLSANAVTLIKEVPTMIVLSQAKTGGGTQLDYNGNQFHYPDIDLWDLKEFLRQALTP